MKKDADIIILGAGPAGLSLGHLLSKKYSVIVLEKGETGNVCKTDDWTTEEKVMRQAGLSDFISIKFHDCYFHTLLGTQLCIHDKLISINAKKITNFFINSIKTNGGRIIDYCSFSKIISSNSSGIVIKAGKRTFSSRMLIDCTGHQSILAKENKIYKKIFYYPIFGGEYFVKLKNQEIVMVDSIIKKTPLYYIQVLPIAKNRCVFYTFQFLDRYKDPDLLQKVHRYHLDHSFIKDLFYNKKRLKRIKGVIPMGVVNKNSLDRVAFFGDSVLMSGSLNGMGFTNIIRHHKKFTKHISECLDRDTLNARSLNYGISRKEKLNRNIQFALCSILVNFDSKKFAKAVDSLKRLPNELIIDLLSMNMTQKKLGLLISYLQKDLADNKTQKRWLGMIHFSVIKPEIDLLISLLEFRITNISKKILKNLKTPLIP